MNKPRPDQSREAVSKTPVCGEAVATVDPLEALSEMAPAKAAAAILRLAEGPGVVDPARLLKLVVEISARLRHRQRFELALRVTNAIDIPSPRLRLERALAAFGCRDDARVSELMAQDPVLAALLKPGVALVQSRPLPKMPNRVPALLRDLYAVCQCAQAMSNGGGASVRELLDGVAEEHDKSLKTKIWRHLAHALTSPSQAQALKAVHVLEQRRLFRRQKSLRAGLRREHELRFASAPGVASQHKRARVRLTAGQLANELLVRFRQLTQDTDAQAVRHLLEAEDLKVHFTALDSDERTALEAAVVCFSSQRLQVKPWINHAIDLLGQVVRDGRNATWIGAAVLRCSSNSADRMLWARALAHAQLPTNVVEPMAHWVAADSEASVARNFMLAVSCTLDVGAVSRILAAIDRQGSAPLGPDLQATLGELCPHLRPECDLVAYLPSRNVPQQAMVLPPALRMKPKPRTTKLSNVKGPIRCHE